MGATELPPFTEFRINARIRNEVARVKKEEMDAGDANKPASRQERKEMIRKQEERAKNREAMEQSGRVAPSTEGQKDRLKEVQEAKERRPDPEELEELTGA